MIAMILATMAAAATVDVTIPGPAGPLGAAWNDPGKGAPAVILIPGSGPTDLDGNNRLGVRGSVYRQLGDALAAKAIATLRIDKRGMFSSKAAIPDANKVRLADYAGDVRNWVSFVVSKGKPCAWLMGHSEGGLIALAAAQQPAHLCGLILLAAPGRPIGTVLREQLRPKLPADMMASVDVAIHRLEKGEHVDPASVPAPVAPLFNPPVQDFLIDLATTDPAQLAKATTLPMLIVRGESDVQVAAADADALAAARPDAIRVNIPRLNHVFKDVDPADRAANLASYGDEKQAIDPALATTIARFVLKKR